LAWTAFLAAEEIGSLLNRGSGHTANTTTAYHYLKSHAGRAYFPTEPLAHLAAEGKQYHFEFGGFDRELARFTVTPEHFNAEIPADTELIGIPPDLDPAEVGSVRYVLEHHMADFRPGPADPALPGWLCYRRTSEPPAPADPATT